MDELLEAQDLQVFDENQREVLLKILKKLESTVDKRVEQALQDRGQDVEFTETDKEVASFYAKDKARLKKALDIWKSNGRIPGTNNILEWNDFVDLDKKFTMEARDSFSSDYPLLIPRVVSEVVKEAIEPNIVLTPLFQRINYQYGVQLTFPAVGALAAADIPEGGEYPERSLEWAGQVVATIGKSGIAVKVTEEMRRYALYDVMSLHLRAAGRALIRHKEQKVADQIITNSGDTNTLFDNTSASYRSTTGRNAGGGLNGTLTLNDLIYAYATMVNRGFMPNTLIMNPFAWQIFQEEGLARIFGFLNGGSMWNAMQGQPGNAPQWSNGNFGNGLLQNTTVTSPENVATTYTNVPTIFPYPFRIVISPFMPFYATSNTTDLVLCDSSELGILVVDEEVMTEEWDDPARDITKVKLRERYGLGSMNEGKGSGILKGVALARNYDFGNNISVNFSGEGLSGSLVLADTGNNAVLTTNS